MSNRRKPIPTTPWFRPAASFAATRGIARGPYAPLRPAPDTRTWRPGDGDLAIAAQDATATLRIEAHGVTLAGLFAAIRVDPGSPSPRPGPGEIGLEGVRGSLTLHGATIRFAGLAALVLVEPRHPARPAAAAGAVTAAAPP